MTSTGWFLLGGVVIIAAVWVWCVREKPKPSNVTPLFPQSTHVRVVNRDEAS